MRNHDPRTLVEDLRGHLAAPDRHLAFLFGAGTSCSVRKRDGSGALIPDLTSLTANCERAVTDLGVPFAAAWGRLVKQTERPGRGPNVEDILSSVRSKIAALGEGETLVGLERDQLVQVEAVISKAIAFAVSPAETDIPSDTPQEQFARWIKQMVRSAPLEIFTTNYDILIERGLERSRVPVFDGFVGSYRPFFFPECIDDEALLPVRSWVRLWKIHGSINWQLEGEGNHFRIVRTNDLSQGALILPSHYKYHESRKQPHLSFTDRLSKVLSLPHALLIACGYSFSDEHLNAIIFGALDSRDATNVVALQFGDLDPEGPLETRALRRSNLSVVGPNGAVIDRVWGEWQLTEPVDRRTHGFMDFAFDSNAAPEPPENGEPPAELTGMMRLGDFAWFSRFLLSMGLGDQ